MNNSQTVKTKVQIAAALPIALAFVACTSDDNERPVPAIDGSADAQTDSAPDSSVPPVDNGLPPSDDNGRPAPAADGSAGAQTDAAPDSSVPPVDNGLPRSDDNGRPAPAADGSAGAQTDAAPDSSVPPVDNGLSPSDGPELAGTCKHIAVTARAEMPGGIGPIDYAGAAWGGDAYIVIWNKRIDNKGFGFARITTDGELVADPTELWVDKRGADRPKLAVSGDRLAVAYYGHRANDAVCRLGIASTSGASVLPPVDFGGDAAGASVQNCHVAPYGSNEFMAVWSEIALSKDTDRSLYAQRYDLDGKPLGNPITIIGGLKGKGLQTGFQLAPLGDKLLIQHPGVGDAPTLSTIDAKQQVGSTPLSVSGPPSGKPNMIMRWTGRSVHLRWLDNLAAIDAQGNVTAGLVQLPWQTYGVAPTATLGDASAMIYAKPGASGLRSDTYLVASLISDDLKTISTPVGLSTVRGSTEALLVHAGATASHAGILHYSYDGRTFSIFGCSDQPPGPIGLPTCPTDTDTDSYTEVRACSELPVDCCYDIPNCYPERARRIDMVECCVYGDAETVKCIPGETACTDSSAVGIDPTGQAWMFSADCGISYWPGWTLVTNSREHFECSKTTCSGY